MTILVPLRKLLTSLRESIKSLTIHIKHLKTMSLTLKYLKCILKTFFKWSVINSQDGHTFAKKETMGVFFLTIKQLFQQKT